MSGNREHPGNLPLLPMGLGATSLRFEEGADFWNQVKRVTADSSLADNLDVAMAGESSPRIWLFLHEPGQGNLSTAAALAIAQELGARDQAALILDCDDQGSQLTRWAGRHEAEGWIDLVRYGASVLTSGVAVPFQGRRAYVLGVGSFTPTDVTQQEAEDLVNRLKRQADDLILVAPANSLGRLWAQVADIRLLCWDRARKPADLIERVCDSFEDADCQLTGLIGFGLPEEGISLGTVTGSTGFEQDQEEAVDQESEDVGDEDYQDERFTADDLEDVDYSDLDEASEEDPIDEDPVDDQEEDQEEDPDEDRAENNGEPVDPDDLKPSPHYTEASEKEETGSSRVFWMFAMVSLLVIVVVSVFYLKYVRVDEPVPGQEQDPVVAQVDEAHSAPIQTQEVAEADSEPVDVAITDQDPNAVDMGSETPDEDQNLAEGDEQSAEPQGTSVTPAQEDLTDPQDPVSEAEEELFTMDPYLQSVGTDGWALHLYSFPDSIAAQDQAKQLERKGFRTVTRPVQFKDKGRWFRVYVGSFMSRGEALEAKDLLFEQLNIDWARATEF